MICARIFTGILSTLFDTALHSADAKIATIVFTISKNASVRAAPSTKYTSLFLPFQLESFFLHKAFELIQKLTIAFADRIDDACQHGLHSANTVFKQSIDHVFRHSALDLLGGIAGGVEISTALFSTAEQPFLKQTVECGHYGRIGVALVQGGAYACDVGLALTANRVHRSAFEVAEGI